jgi:23S rRNA-/tRNA-specific pseudouridylate synthase
MLYEDDAMVVLDKPAGLPAVPIDGSDTPSALSLLSAKLALKRQRAFVVHRIDRFTSGVLLKRLALNFDIPSSAFQIKAVLGGID